MNYSVRNSKMEKGRKRSLIHNYWSKLKGNKETTLVHRKLSNVSPPPGAAHLQMLKTIFDHWEMSSLQVIYDANQCNFHSTVDCLLDMDKDNVQEQDNERNSFMEKKVSSQDNVFHPNLLPDDFLRVPIQVQAAVQHEEEEKIQTDEKNIEHEVNVQEWKSEKVLISRRSAIEEEGDTRVRSLTEPKRQNPDPPVTATAIVEESLCSTLLQNTRLDLHAARSRIKDKESGYLFDWLAKASVLYQNGVINSEELIRLRKEVSAKPKYFNDDSIIINDHEWALLVLKCRGIRPAVSARIVEITHSALLIPSIKESSHAIYCIRVVDISTGISWTVQRRYKEFHKVYKKIHQLVKRICTISFPGKKAHSQDISKERLPMLQAFLHCVCSLVSPLPVGYLRGCALKELGTFLNIPQHLPRLQQLSSSSSLQSSNRIKVLLYHLLADPQNPEGKACLRFSGNCRQHGLSTNIMEELEAFLDNVQAYLLQNRFVLLKKHVHAHGVTFPTQDDLMLYLSDIVRCEVEEAVFVPIMVLLNVHLELKHKVQENKLQKKILALRRKTQTFFEIPNDQISPSGWQSVVEKLNGINTVDLPSEKLHQLVLSANEIHLLYMKEHNTLPSDNEHVHSELSRRISDEMVLSGDDFLPIYIYVLVQCKVYPLYATLELLSSLCDPEKRLGESGYYLATFEAAMHHIMSLNENDGV